MNPNNMNPVDLTLVRLLQILPNHLKSHPNCNKATCSLITIVVVEVAVYEVQRAYCKPCMIQSRFFALSHFNPTSA